MSPKPLSDRRVVVTRHADQADTVCERLNELGAKAIPFPVSRLIPLASEGLEAAMSDLAQYDWLIFTSANAVRILRQHLAARSFKLDSVRVAAVGAATAACLREMGATPDFVPEAFLAERIPQGLGDLNGRRILLPRSRIGRPEIVAGLRGSGALVDEVAVYDTVLAEPPAEAWRAIRKPIDCLTFASPSSIRFWFELLKRRGSALPTYGQSPAVACIGPVTAAEASAFGLAVEIIPETYTVDGLLAAIVQFFKEKADSAE